MSQNIINSPEWSYRTNGSGQSIPEHLKNITQEDIDKWNEGANRTLPEHLQNITQEDIDKWNNREDITRDDINKWNNGENIDNKVTVLSKDVTDKQYPSAKLLYDSVTEIKGTLTKIEITNMPTTLEYRSGDKVDISGLEVTAFYSSGISIVVTNKCTIVASNPLTTADTSVIVRFENLETSYDIVVLNANVVPNDTLVLMHFENTNINEITGDSTNISSISVYGNSSYAKFGDYSARCGTVQISNFTGIPTATELTNGDSELTVSFWLYLNSSKTVLTLHQSTANNNFFNMYCSSNNVSVKFNGSSTSTTATIEEGLSKVWSHFAIVIKEGYINVFCNGKKILTEKLSSSGTIPVRIKFGESDTATIYIDELLVCKKALYTEDFTPLSDAYVLPS